VSGRDGKTGAVEVEVEVEVAGLSAEGEVVVMAVEAAGLPAVGAVDNAFPVCVGVRNPNPGKMNENGTLEGGAQAGGLTTCACSLPRFWRRYRRHNRVQQPSMETRQMERNELGRRRVEVERWRRIEGKSRRMWPEVEKPRMSVSVFAVDNGAHHLIPLQLYLAMYPVVAIIRFFSLI